MNRGTPLFSLFSTCGWMGLFIDKRANAAAWSGTQLQLHCIYICTGRSLTAVLCRQCHPAPPATRRPPHASPHAQTTRRNAGLSPIDQWFAWAPARPGRASPSRLSPRCERGASVRAGRQTSR
ncbi:hypothetical protein EJ04DRAFT_259014 [Polyplosphaeria fusca]|uniref:Uncharacterized protein n=1 Tax=Polyplosphaeria fusca TaxID=682080 RepID=A0A9P4V8T7_9PLEO|nr:hypothetical protein EJ04DRAFT_259014 [Polyplosphaeria fusca]